MPLFILAESKPANLLCLNMCVLSFLKGSRLSLSLNICMGFACILDCLENVNCKSHSQRTLISLALFSFDDSNRTQGDNSQDAFLCDINIVYVFISGSCRNSVELSQRLLN